mmetsp:Transcript_35523/g.63496  ORF Transcript_35523/g.63496 Transcript_35523/m.63496 type:complete len:215 (+) Transcript_35523:607-1251(+)
MASSTACTSAALTGGITSIYSRICSASFAICSSDLCGWPWSCCACIAGLCDDLRLLLCMTTLPSIVTATFNPSGLKWFTWNAQSSGMTGEALERAAALMRCCSAQLKSLAGGVAARRSVMGGVDTRKPARILLEGGLLPMPPRVTTDLVIGGAASTTVSGTSAGVRGNAWLPGPDNGDQSVSGSAWCTRVDQDRRRSTITRYGVPLMASISRFS